MVQRHIIRNLQNVFKIKYFNSSKPKNLKEFFEEKQPRGGLKITFNLVYGLIISDEHQIRYFFHSFLIH